MRVSILSALHTAVFFVTGRSDGVVIEDELVGQAETFTELGVWYSDKERAIQAWYHSVPIAPANDEERQRKMGELHFIYNKHLERIMQQSLQEEQS